MMDIDQTYHYPDVTRDLVWATQSPYILNESALPENVSLPLISPDTEQFKRLHSDPAPLIEFCTKENTQLVGTYFEALWRYYLQQHPHVHHLMNNIQIFNQQKQTIGEFDLIYENTHQQSLIHLELAFKVYLGNPNPALNMTDDDHTRWIGPNCRDRLDIKLHKLFSHQLRLSQNPYAQQQLQRLGIPPTRLNPQLAMMGILFYPAFDQLPPPHGASQKHQRGVWVYEHQLKDFLDLHVNQTYFNKPKHTWISPIIQPHTACLNADQLITLIKRHFQSKHFPLLISHMEAPDKPIHEESSTPDIHRLVETTCFFVVPKHWPFIT